METIQHNVKTLINTWREGLFEWQYQLSMIFIFTEEFIKLPKEKQTKVKERFAKTIKGNRKELDLSGCGIQGTEFKYELIPNIKEI